MKHKCYTCDIEEEIADDSDRIIITNEVILKNGSKFKESEVYCKICGHNMLVVYS